MTAATKSHTALVLYRGCIFQEISAALTMLRDKFPLIVATPDGKPVLVNEGFHVNGDIPYHDLDLASAAVVLVPGGDCQDIIENQVLADKLKDAVSRKVLVAGICNGALLLAKSTILNGRRCTHTCTSKYAPLPEFKELLDVATPLFSSSVYCDEDVVVDGGIVTAKPWAFIDFGAMVAELTGALTSDAGRKRRAYLKGSRDEGDNASQPAETVLDDGELLTRFERAELEPEQWIHRTHVRIGYLYLRAHPFADAFDRMRAGVKALNRAHGRLDMPLSGYHETMTGAWLRLIDATIRHQGSGADSNDFCDSQPQLLSKKALRLFYSASRIMAPEAKVTFVEPDLTAFPK